MSVSKASVKDDPTRVTVQPRRVSVEMGGTMTRDDARLEDLGYKPELKRNFSKFETFGGEHDGLRDEQWPASSPTPGRVRARAHPNSLGLQGSQSRPI